MGTTDNFDSSASGALALTDTFPVIAMPWKVQLRSTIGPACPPPVAAYQMLSPLPEQRSSKSCPAFGANSAGFDDP